MPYASVADLQAVIPPRDLALLSDFEGGAEAADADRLARALDDASAEIDSFIARQVSLPLTDPPHILKVICRDLAMCRLYLNLGRLSETNEKLRDQAIGWLRDVSEGKISLGDDDTPATPTSGGVAMSDGPERRFTRQSLRGY
ncbi:gp436 family protein [Palleronia caenipelagi]|uniref:DUF1320 domain-containing protein n=1 Tax=Palleronia caenipelagi TaxID=2489174 RepID=A0A547PW36_9RHOB|nr:DUF1320 domain-containing protein [Palleronia caenipelagi]TRD18343.1 DUF1320 domain-containing protein [Palleronia caenipelagi]